MPVTSRLWQDRGLCAHMATARYGTSILYGPELRVNLTHPEHSALLQAPLAKEAGGWGLCTTPDRQPVFRSADDPDYQSMLRGIRVAQARLYTWPRVDMAPAHVEAVRKTLTTGMDFSEPKPPALALSDGLSVLPRPPKEAVNLALGARASSNDRVPVEKASDTPDKAVDGNASTNWDDVDNASEYDLTVQFPKSTAIAVVSITGWRRQDFAPKSFTLLADGKVIGTVTDAPYSNNRLILRFPSVTCLTFALRITTAYGGSPAIRELELYECPTTESKQP